MVLVVVLTGRASDRDGPKVRGAPSGREFVGTQRIFVRYIQLPPSLQIGNLSVHSSYIAASFVGASILHLWETYFVHLQKRNRLQQKCWIWREISPLRLISRKNSVDFTKIDLRSCQDAKMGNMAFPQVNFLRILLVFVSVLVPFIHGVRIEEKGKKKEIDFTKIPLNIIVRSDVSWGAKKCLTAEETSYVCSKQ